MYNSFFPPQWRLTLTIPFIRCGVREMHTSFSLWPQPYFPSFGLKRTNKPSIFKFSEECFPSSWFLNAFKWKKELKTDCCWGDLQALWNYCFSASQTQWLAVLPPDSQTAGIGQDDAVQNCLNLFFFLNVSYHWMQTRINFSWANGLAQLQGTCWVCGLCK